MLGKRTETRYQNLLGTIFKQIDMRTISPVGRRRYKNWEKGGCDQGKQQSKNFAVLETHTEAQRQILFSRIQYSRQTLERSLPSRKEDGSRGKQGRNDQCAQQHINFGMLEKCTDPVPKSPQQNMCNSTVHRHENDLSCEREEV